MTKYEAFINYAFATSDVFSLQVNVQDHHAVIDHLQPFLLHEKHINKNTVICFYRCSDDTEKIIVEAGEHVFDWDGECFPEDLYFYRNEQKKSVEKFRDPSGWGSIRIYQNIEPWYYSLAHEQQNWLRTIKKEDLQFFEQSGIEVKQLDQDEWEILWNDFEEDEPYGYSCEDLFEFDDNDPDDIGYRLISVK